MKIQKILKKNQKGFTLVELIVVIAILGILAAIAIPRFIGTMDNANNKVHNANVRTIESAITLYQADTDTALADIDDIGVLVSSGYLKSVPTNPIKSGAAYTVTNGVISPAAVSAATN